MTASHGTLSAGNKERRTVSSSRGSLKAIVSVIVLTLLHRRPDELVPQVVLHVTEAGGFDAPRSVELCDRVIVPACEELCCLCPARSCHRQPVGNVEGLVIELVVQLIPDQVLVTRTLGDLRARDALAPVNNARTEVPVNLSGRH